MSLRRLLSLSIQSSRPNSCQKQSHLAKRSVGSERTDRTDARPLAARQMLAAAAGTGRKAWTHSLLWTETGKTERWAAPSGYLGITDCRTLYEAGGCRVSNSQKRLSPVGRAAGLFAGEVAVQCSLR